MFVMRPTAAGPKVLAAAGRITRRPWIYYRRRVWRPPKVDIHFVYARLGGGINPGDHDLVLC